MSDIKIGNTVKLMYWKNNKIYDFVIVDIFFEAYVSGYKTIIKAKYYSKECDCWFVETYFINDFFKALEKAREEKAREETS